MKGGLLNYLKSMEIHQAITLNKAIYHGTHS
jgi:hypothetical protein